MNRSLLGSGAAARADALGPRPFLPPWQDATGWNLEMGKNHTEQHNEDGSSDEVFKVFCVNK